MRWQVKCLIDSCKALIPFQARLRALKDSISPYIPDERKDAQTIGHGLQQLEWLNSVRPINGAVVMEIGTGWQPMIPVLLSLAGAERVYLTDLNRLCRPDTFDATLQSLRSQKRAILNQLPISEEEFDRAVRPGHGDMEERFRDLRLVYLAPCDCRRLKLQTESIDIVTSRAVLEHIPPQIIRDIFVEAGRVLRPDGVMCHFVDNSDHWEHNDKSISPVNFLKFSDPVFRWTTVNGLNYQNRLRHSQYLAMLRDTGFQVVRETGDIDAGALAALRSLAIAPRFRAFTAEDLATTKSYLLASRVPVTRPSSVHAQTGVSVV